MNKFKYLIATLGGFQFGYAIGIMAGAVLFIASQFALTPEQQGLAVSAFLMGALPGTAVAGPLANRLGRKRTQQLMALVFIFGTLLVVTASALPQLMAGRILQGIASGGFSVVGPLYLAEVCPAESRGFFVGCYQLAVTLGIFVAYGVNWALSFSGSWEWMFILGAIPALVHFFGFFLLPDSRPAENQPSHAPWKTLLEPGIRHLLIIAILINVFQQITGVNAILYFAPSIFQVTGFASASSAMLPAVFLGSINFIMTIFATFLIDKWGRRPLLIGGIIGMILSLFGLSIAFLSSPETMKWLATSSIMIFIAAFAVSMGPMPQLIGTEIFPRRVRGQAISIAQLSNWIFNFIVVFTFLDLTSKVSHAGAFALYGGFGILALFFILKYIPETKGRLID
ncbi:MAG TPA: MFS transporter [Rhabdochlamydiaceae bacterium]|nr:MFS transporter [Rhabdochlamydiaceae bacterium]